MTNDPHRDQPVRHYGAPLKEAQAAMILVHGRGASAADILGLAHEMHHPQIAYLAPDAANHTWYPYSFLAPIEQNEPWLSSALRKIRSVLDGVLAAGIAQERVVMAGFSQGACLMTEFVARNPARYGAVIAFTGGLIGLPEHKFDYTGSLGGTPAFFGSGDPDPHVPWERVRQSAEIYTQLGAVVKLERYAGMPHMINNAELEQAKVMVASLVKA